MANKYLSSLLGAAKTVGKTALGVMSPAVAAANTIKAIKNRPTDGLGLAPANKQALTSSFKTGTALANPATTGASYLSKKVGQTVGTSVRSLAGDNPYAKPAGVVGPKNAQQAATAQAPKATTMTPIAPGASQAGMITPSPTSAVSGQTVVPAVSKATLVGPNGERVAVQTGSQEAKNYFGQGYKLEGAKDTTAAPAFDMPKETATLEDIPSDQSTRPAGEPVVDPLQEQLDALRTSYLESLKLSPEEQKKQEELDALNEQANAAIYGVDAEGSQRGFTTGYATGLKGALGRQAEIAKLPLEARIANLQAARQAEQQSTNAKLGFVQSDVTAQREREKEERGFSREDAAAKRTILVQALQNGATQEQMAQILAAKTPEQAIQVAGNLLTPKQKKDYITLSEGQSVIDPTTGERIYTAPKTVKEDDDWSSERLSEAEAANLGVPYGTTRGEAQGSSRLDPLKQESQSTVNSSTAALGEKLGLIDEVLSSRGLSGTVGTWKWGRWTPFKLDAADKKVFLAQVDKLVDTETLDKLIDLKSRGGTLGALSETELDILKSSATTISRLIEKDENGVPTGKIKISEKLFEDEVNKLKAKTMDAVARLQGFEDFKHLKEVVGGDEALNKAIEEFGGLGAVAKAYAQGDDPNGLFDEGGDSQGLFTSAPSTALNGSIGSLSERFESKGDPGIIGYDQTGGYSYGTYQLAHDNAKRFVEQSPYANQFKGLAFNSPQFRNRWAQVAQRDPNGFAQAQKAYIAKTHYEPQLQKIQQETGLQIARLSPAMKDVIWSTAVQHGANSPIVVNALKTLGKGATEAQVIDKIYGLRWSGGQQFRSSTPQTRQAVKNRFLQERQLALSKLNNRRTA